MGAWQQQAIAYRPRKPIPGPGYGEALMSTIKNK